MHSTLPSVSSAPASRVHEGEDDPDEGADEDYDDENYGSMSGAFGCVVDIARV